jgi:hypothetical protein
VTKKQKKYLSKTIGGFTDRSGNWMLAHGYEHQGLVTISEKVIAIRNVGIVPVPHVTITEHGRKLLGDHP